MAEAPEPSPRAFDANQARIDEGEQIGGETTSPSPSPSPLQPSDEKEVGKTQGVGKRKWTKRELYRISQPVKYGLGLLNYAMFIYATGNLVLTIVTSLQLVKTSYVVVESSTTLAADEGLGIANIVIAGILWLISLAIFIFWHIICQTAPDFKKEACLRANLSDCAQNVFRK